MTKNWRPELVLKDVALDMLDIIFDPEATITDCEMAISTLIEIIKPDGEYVP